MKKALFIIFITSVIVIFLNIHTVTVSQTSSVVTASDNGEHKSQPHSQATSSQRISANKQELSENKVNHTAANALPMKPLNAITLTKGNVPQPFIVFDLNVRLTLQDYKNMLQHFEQFGSPIRYKRKESETISGGDWWLEHHGYNESGEPLFSITDLNSFTEQSFELTNKLFDYDIEELHNDSSFGQYNLEVENFAKDSLYSYGINADSVLCRANKCLIKLYHNDDSNFDIVAFTEQVIAHMLNIDAAKTCSSAWAPIKPNGNVITITCKAS